MSALTMQSSAPTDMRMSHDTSMGENDVAMKPQQADQGIAVNHWLDVYVTQSASGALVNDLTPTIRIVDKSTGEARDLPGVMGMTGGMNATDFHYGQHSTGVIQRAQELGWMTRVLSKFSLPNTGASCQPERWATRKCLAGPRSSSRSFRAQSSHLLCWLKQRDLIVKPYGSLCC